jgi:hypothetical protein
MPTLINTTGLTKAEVMAAIEKKQTDNVYLAKNKIKGRRYGTHYKNNDLYFGL